VSGRPASLGEILDGAGEAVPALLAPWVGVLWLASVPLRLVQAHGAATLLELGDDAASYGHHLDQLARAAALAFLVSLWGRAVFCRACALWLRGALGPGSLIPLRVPSASFAGYAVVALAAEVAFFATAPALVTLPGLVIVAGLAAASSPLFDRPGPLSALAATFGNARRAGPLVGALAVVAAGWVLAAVNLFALLRGCAWLAGAAGVDAMAWQPLLSHANPRLLLLLGAAAALLVEPWWLAALVVHVHERRARRSGEDLRLRFERVRSAA
jgi:hypothetical protein